MFFARFLGVIVAALFVAMGAYAFGVKKAPEAKKENPVVAAQATAPAKDQIWVKKPDGGLSCDANKAPVVGLEAGRAELNQAGVEVFDSKKANDGLMRAAVCGISTGNENHFLIRAKDLEAAKKHGYSIAQ